MHPLYLPVLPGLLHPQDSLLLLLQVLELLSLRYKRRLNSSNTCNSNSKLSCGCNRPGSTGKYNGCMWKYSQCSIGRISINTCNPCLQWHGGVDLQLYSM